MLLVGLVHDGVCALCSFLQATLNFGKKDEPVYIIEEKGVIGLNFHQSKEAQLQDHANGYYDVSCLHFFFSHSDI